MIDPRRRSAFERWLRRGFHALPAPIRRPVRRLRARLLYGGRRPARPVALPGRGPVVLLDGRGLPWPDVATAIGTRSDRTERLVVVTDQPEMHLARELPVVIEYVAADGAVDADRRMWEIRRVYAVELVEQLASPCSGTVTTC